MQFAIQLLLCLANARALSRKLRVARQNWPKQLALVETAKAILDRLFEMNGMLGPARPPGIQSMLCSRTLARILAVANAGFCIFRPSRIQLEISVLAGSLYRFCLAGIDLVSVLCASGCARYGPNPAK